MLTDELIDRILGRLPDLTVGVLGDLFLDRYLDIDAALTEPSIETGLDAYQVVRVRSSPGAAGTVINNLAALGVGRIVPVSLIGDDGEGYELRQALARMPAVVQDHLLVDPTRRTPTYTKPMLKEANRPPRELNRLDIKNRVPTPERQQAYLARLLDQTWPSLDALLVLDQVSEAECGVVTTLVRDRLAVVGGRQPDRLILADSRERIGEFRNVSLKPNRGECQRAVASHDVMEGIQALAQRTGRALFCTSGEEGIILGSPDRKPVRVAGYPVSGPVDPVGAGDSTSAGIACAVAAGATWEQAAAFGNLVASITVQQIGTTGTASPDQVRQRWREVSG